MRGRRERFDSKSSLDRPHEAPLTKLVSKLSTKRTFLPMIHWNLNEQCAEREYRIALPQRASEASCGILGATKLDHDRPRKQDFETSNSLPQRLISFVS